MKTGDFLSPIGVIRFVYSDEGLEELYFLHATSIVEFDGIGDLFFDKVCEELKAYFSGKLTVFSIPLVNKGTSFQRNVWSSLPGYGKTISYGELAKNLGDVNASRAVANANAKNPCMILIPCHRVIGKDGALTGYAGGVKRKKFLLELENGVRQGGLF